MPSGVYGIRLRAGGDEDVIPVFIRPASGARKNKLAVLVPTITYQIYANYSRHNFDDEYRRRSSDWKSYPNHPAEHPEFGLSGYDTHLDGSGVCYTSLRRPLLTMRPGYFAYIDRRGSGRRHFPADMHLVAWLEAKSIEYDVVTCPPSAHMSQIEG